MKSNLISFYKRLFQNDGANLSAEDQRLAKNWTKHKLLHWFPELRNNPAALEKAYRQLSLEPAMVRVEEEESFYFEIVLPKD